MTALLSFLLIFHFVFGLIASALIWSFQDSVSAVSFALGAGVIFLNLVALTMTWPRLLSKKNVALASGVIVFKFAILGFILYLVAYDDRIQTGWFFIGMATVLLSVVASSIKMRPKKS